MDHSPYRIRNNIIMGKKQLTTEEFIFRAKIIHNNKYYYDKTNYKTYNIKVIITCPQHGDFTQTPHSHLNGTGCMECGRIKTINSNKKITTQLFIEKAKQIHNNIYTYNKTNYKDYNKKVIITCKEHGDFYQTIFSHLAGSGCPECGRLKANNSLRSTKEDFVEKAQNIHKERYSYDNFIYIDAHIPGLITCHIHGNFMQSADSHLRGRGCSKCSGKRQSNTIEFINKANIVHNFRYDYSHFEYITCKKPSIIICKIHGEFYQNANNHLQGRGCSKCSSNISIMESLWLDTFNLKNSGIQIKINDLIIKPDGYDPISNTIYEFYGDYWHGNPKIYHKDDINMANNKKFGELYQKTLEREYILKEAGYNLITIWESDWKKLSKKK